MKVAVLGTGMVGQAIAGKLAELGHELQCAFPDREVDVAVLNRADPLFLKQVMERSRLVHGDEGQLAADTRGSGGPGHAGG